MKLGAMVPRFPGQTHIAFWRCVSAMEEAGHEVVWLSTRRPDLSDSPHPKLSDLSQRTHYLFPPSFLRTLALFCLRPVRLLKALRYVGGLRESGLKEKLACLAMLPMAADLCRFAGRRKLDHIFLHSCADAAHIVAMCFLLGGPPFTLRAGGDLDVYGKDHASKMRYASHIIAASESVRQEIIRRVGISPEKILAVWFGVDTQRFGCDDTRPRPDNRLVLITVARLNRVKGHAFAIQAVSKLAAQGVPILYRIVGTGPYEPELRDLVVELGAGDLVEFLGAKSEEEIICLLQQADIFVLASWGKGEASPVALQEAMASGLPVISTIIGGTPDMVEEAVDGFLIPQEDVAAIVDRVVVLYRDWELRRTMGERARQHAERAFDCRESARRILAALASN